MKIVIIGARTAAITVADILIQDRNFIIEGFVGTEEEEKDLSGKRLYGNIPFLGSRKILSKLKDEGVVGFIVAVGDNYFREKRYYEAMLLGLTPINAISRQAIIEPSVKIGKGVIINTGCILSHGVSIGNNTYLGCGVIIEINSKIGENCLLNSGCIIGGLSEIGRNVTFGPRSTIGMGKRIGKNQYVKPGAVVDKDLADKVRSENNQDES